MSELENYQTADFAQECGALLSKIPGVFSATSAKTSWATSPRSTSWRPRGATPNRSAGTCSPPSPRAFHREVDHRTISIAQIDSSAYAGVDEQRMRQAARLRYAGMNVSMREGRRVYQVRLTREDAEFAGEASCPNSLHQKRRAVAEAHPSAPWRARSRWRGNCRWSPSTARTWTAYRSSFAPSNTPKRGMGGCSSARRTICTMMMRPNASCARRSMPSTAFAADSPCAISAAFVKGG